MCFSLISPYERGKWIQMEKGNPWALQMKGYKKNTVTNQQFYTHRKPSVVTKSLIIGKGLRLGLNHPLISLVLVRTVRNQALV